MHKREFQVKKASRINKTMKQAPTDGQELKRLEALHGDELCNEGMVAAFD